MPKLSPEAWKIAFFDVMKEQMPPDKASLKRAGQNLGEQKLAAQQALEAAKSKAELAKAVADDAEKKRYGAGVALDEARSRTLTEEGRLSAQRDYDQALQRVRDAAELAKQARIAQKEQAFKLQTLEAQTAEIAQRLDSGKLNDLCPELAQALQHAKLEKRLEAEQSIIEELDGRLRARQEALQDAKRNYREGEALILTGDVAALQERVQRALAKCDAIEALLPGFALEAAEVSNTEKLAQSVQRMQGAAKASDEALASAKARTEEQARDQQAKDGLLEAAAARNPVLKSAMDTLTDKRATLSSSQQALAEAQEDLQAAEKKYKLTQAQLDAYASGSTAQPESQRELENALDAIGTRTQVMSVCKGELRTQQDLARKGAAEVKAAKQALTEAIDAQIKLDGSSGELAVARQALLAVEAELGRAAASEKQAKEAADRVHQLADEAARRLKHAQTLPQASATVGEFNEALKGVEDVPIWDGSTALLGKLGQARYDKLHQLALKLAGEYETLCTNGATMEDLQAIYKDTPDLWKPPRFREEEKNWVAMKDLVDEEAEDKYSKETETRLGAVDKKIATFKSGLKAGDTVASALVSGMKGAKALGDMAGGTLEAIGAKLSEHKELVEKAELVLSLAAKLTTVLQAPLKAIDSAQQSMETEDPVEALMLQDEFMASLGELVEGLTGAIEGADKLKIGGALVEQMASLLPGIGVATNAAAAMKGLVDSAARIQEAMDDADAHAEAQRQAHRGEAALDQFSRRDKHLAARAVTKTGVAMIKTAAAAVDLTGVGVAVSTGMKGAATAVSTVQTVAEQVIDRNEGEKAQALLDRAQAGDGHARAELFRYHPRYAKGILAIMASEGDALALRVLSTHGLNEDMIRRSSPKIIKRYLLKKFGESDTPPSWTSAREAIVSVLTSASAKFQAIDDFFGNVADKLLARFDANDLVAAQARLSDLAYQLSAQASISGAVGSLVEVRVRRETLAASATPEQADDLAALDLALADELKTVDKVRTHVLLSLSQVRLVIAQISKQPAGDLRNKAEAAAKAVLREHLSRVEALATAG